ncbi:MAG: response regulator transcription factor [Clostridiaceae bacterium]|nr:response regulator transcription factor [Clostridiaceae bacterium]
MRILLADDQAEVRSGRKFLLEHEDGISVVGEAEDLGGLINCAEKCNSDVVLLDCELSNKRIEDIIPMLRSACPRLRIIALSSRPEALKSALANGADAFVSKGDQPEVLLNTIRNMKKDY